MEHDALVERVLELLSRSAREPGNVLPAGAGEEQLAAFESRTGLWLPAELREWLRTCNGPLVGPGGIYGVEPVRDFVSIEVHLGYKPVWKEKGWIPVAGDGCGDTYVLDTRSGTEDRHPVYFIDQADETEPDYIVASNLWQFLAFLLQAELDWAATEQKSWPFDEARVLRADPGLKDYETTGLLPWQVDQDRSNESPRLAN